MASLFRPLSVNIMALFLIITTLLLLSLPQAVTSIPTDEFQSMLSTLRYHNYNLFCNALTTSDLLNDVVLSGDSSSFTIFAPLDSSLFALDNTSTASFYIKTLRYHIIPRRFSMSDLERYPSGSSFSTLLPHRHIHVSRRLSPVSDIITVDGIDVVVPGLYYGRDVFVHGLGGILSLKLKIGSSHGLPPPPMLDSSAFPLRTHVDSLVFPPVPSFSPVSHTIPAPSPQLTPRTIISPVPVDSPGNQDSSPAPRHAFLLVQPPAELIPEYENKAVPSFSPVSHTISAPSPQLTAVPPRTIISPVPVDSPGNQDSSPAPRHAFLLVQPPAVLIPEYENKAVPSFSPVSHTISAPSPQLTAVPPRTIISPVPVDSPGNQDSSPAPRHAFLLVQPPAELIPKYENKAVPTSFSKGKARRKMSGRRHSSKRSEASPSLGVEVAAGEICAKNPPMNYEQDLGRWME